MNIFIFELKTYAKSTALWSVAMILLIASSMAKFSTYQSSGLSIQELMASFPKSIQAMFGLTGLDLTTPSGFYGLTFLYVLLVAAIHASLLGANILSKEERDNTEEFLFVKPISRNSVLLQKLFAALLLLLIFNVITLLASLVITALVSGSQSATTHILLMVSGLFFVQLLFFSIGFVSGAMSRGGKGAAGIPVAFLLVSYLIYVITGVSGKVNVLKFVSPINAIDAKNIIDKTALPSIAMLTMAIISYILIHRAFTYYRRKNLD
jgi:ABC-2 type transport system permease protein